MNAQLTSLIGFQAQLQRWTCVKMMSIGCTRIHLCSGYLRFSGVATQASHLHCLKGIMLCGVCSQCAVLVLILKVSRLILCFFYIFSGQYGHRGGFPQNQPEVEFNSQERMLWSFWFSVRCTTWWTRLANLYKLFGMSDKTLKKSASLVHNCGYLTLLTVQVQCLGSQKGCDVHLLLPW
jgi:hypothetical protein